jgi:hypothetical protein
VYTVPKILISISLSLLSSPLCLCAVMIFRFRAGLKRPCYYPWYSPVAKEKPLRPPNSREDFTKYPCTTWSDTMPCVKRGPRQGLSQPRLKHLRKTWEACSPPDAAFANATLGEGYGKRGCRHLKPHLRAARRRIFIRRIEAASS